MIDTGASRMSWLARMPAFGRRRVRQRVIFIDDRTRSVPCCARRCVRARPARHFERMPASFDTVEQLSPHHEMGGIQDKYSR
jgi:hypothetical protein